MAWQSIGIVIRHSLSCAMVSARSQGTMRESWWRVIKRTRPQTGNCKSRDMVRVWKLGGLTVEGTKDSRTAIAHLCQAPAGGDT
eukprot:5263370-Pyramimonas_sp.AAC.1